MQLTAREFELLHLLARNLDRALARDYIFEEIWGYDAEINSRTLDTHIRKLRSKLGDHDEYIETAYGFGYRVIDRRD